MSKLSWHNIKRCVDCDAAIEQLETRCGDCDRVYQRTKPDAYKPGPTQIQVKAAFAMFDEAVLVAARHLDERGVPGVDALLVEWQGRRFAANSGDMFRYAPESSED